MTEIVVLQRDTDSAFVDSPTISLALTVRAGDPSSVLEMIAPHVDELVVVNACELPDHRAAWNKYLAGYAPSRNMPCTIVDVSSESHPHLYDVDAPGTFLRGRSLADESYRGIRAGERFAADWAGIRNVGWSRCTQEWRLALCDDEVLDSPECLRSLCRLLDCHRRDLAYGLLSCWGRTSYVARLARNLPGVLFGGSAREILEGGVRPAIVEGSLTTRAVAARLDAPHAEEARSFRILYAEARRLDWEIPLCNFLHLAQLSGSVGQGSLAPAAISTCLENSLYPEERAWACSLRGEIYEFQGSYADAIASYERSLAESSGWKPALRLCRVLFRTGRYSECLDAYRRGLANQGHHHLCDDGIENFDSTLIYIAFALFKTGEVAASRQCCLRLRELYPQSKRVADLCEALE